MYRVTMLALSASYHYHSTMNSKHRKTLAAIFTDPVSGTIEWTAVEGLLLASGARITGAVREGWRGRDVSPSAPCQGIQAIPGARCPRLPGTDRGETMTNTMNYKGYAARIEYDDEDGIFTGRIAGIRDGVGFHANTVEGLREAFHEAVEDYIESCAKIGKEPQKTYSGQVMFRVSPEVHRKAAMAAELSGKSLNQWAEEVLDRAAG
jgi:predicted HicB family RNase H-like nuclease